MRCWVLGALLALAAAAPRAQTASIRVEVRSDDRPISGAAVTVGDTTYNTGPDGSATVSVLPGHVDIVVAKEGFAPASASTELQGEQSRTIFVVLRRAESVAEQLTVSATRTDTRVEDVPMRVEVLNAEEVQEQVMQGPGDVVNLLREMGGLHVATTSPSLGAAGVRIQGMRGRYTRFLSDGLPLFGEQVGGVGLLQIPPVDLRQVEVIKGVASALYGAGAMGGVVNLLARRPTEQSQEFLLNRSSRGETDAVGYVSQPFNKGWGATLVAGGHWQQLNDVDGDGWADLPSYQRGEIRPRIFWDNGRGSSLFLTAGASGESRTGGTVDGAVIPTTGSRYRETLDTQRYDVGVVGQTLISDLWLLSIRASGTWLSHDHTFGDVRERDRRDTYFGELSIRRSISRHTIVAGVALDRDTFAPRDVPQFAYTFTTPGIFAQDDMTVTRWLVVSASARLDHHSAYGAFLSPRVSALLRSGGWASRVSVGTGFFPSSVLTEETEAAGLSRLTVRGPLRAETGESASVDLTRTVGPFSATGTLFASRIHDSLFVERTVAYVLSSETERGSNVGTELLATYRKEPLSLTAVYGFVRARERETSGFEEVPLTPRQSVTLLGGVEDEEAGRFVVEWFYTGRQRLEANPFRQHSAPFMTVGLLAERAFGKVRIFANAENLNNVRQTQYEPLIRPTRGADGRWTVDAWAPLDGRNINVGIRVKW